MPRLKQLRAKVASLMGLLVIILLIVIVILLATRPAKAAPKPAVITLKPTYIYGEPWAYPDKEIEKWVKTNPEWDKKYWCTVAGVRYKNDDGSSRQEAINQCQPREMLRLVPEPDNPVDPNAVKVCRENGQQLGYVPRQLAARMREHFLKGERWDAILSELTGVEPHPHQWQGANIWLVRHTQPKEPSERTARRPARPDVTA
jgi:hypothetical protein